MEYEPYILAANNVIQGVVYLTAEFFYQKIFPVNYKRELITLPDGGTIGFDWDGAIPDPKTNKKPICILFPGLGGDSDNLYSTALVWDLKKKGFEVATLLFRASTGLPITSAKLNCAA